MAKKLGAAGYSMEGAEEFLDDPAEADFLPADIFTSRYPQRRPSLGTLLKRDMGSRGDGKLEYTQESGISDSSEEGNEHDREILQEFSPEEEKRMERLIVRQDSFTQTTDSLTKRTFRSLVVHHGDTDVSNNDIPEEMDDAYSDNLRSDLQDEASQNSQSGSDYEEQARPLDKVEFYDVDYRPTNSHFAGNPRTFWHYRNARDDFVPERHARLIGGRLTRAESHNDPYRFDTGSDFSSGEDEVVILEHPRTHASAITFRTPRTADLHQHYLLDKSTSDELIHAKIRSRLSMRDGSLHEQSRVNNNRPASSNRYYETEASVAPSRERRSYNVRHSDVRLPQRRPIASRSSPVYLRSNLVSARPVSHQVDNRRSAPLSREVPATPRGLRQEKRLRFVDSDRTDPRLPAGFQLGRPMSIQIEKSAYVGGSRRD